MQHLTDKINATHGLLNPRPVEPHERTAAGLDDLLPYEPRISFTTLLVVAAFSFVLWAGIIQCGSIVYAWLVEP